MTTAEELSSYYDLIIDLVDEAGKVSFKKYLK